MANPTVSLNQKITDPTLTDLGNLWIKRVMLSLNCHAVATVQSFDKDAQTIQATINYKKSFLQRGADGVYNSVLIDYPILLDVPVIVLRGGQARLTFPIQSGDNCLICFNDRDLDNWLQSGQIAGTASGRLHSFSDGIAIVGLSPLSDPLQDYDDTRAVLSWGTTLVGVGPDKVKIANAMNTLNDLLQELITDITDLVNQTALITVTCTAPGTPSSPPINAAAIAAVATELSTTATKIAGLLE